MNKPNSEVTTQPKQNLASIDIISQPGPSSATPHAITQEEEELLASEFEEYDEYDKEEEIKMDYKIHNIVTLQPIDFPIISHEIEEEIGKIQKLKQLIISELEDVIDEDEFNEQITKLDQLHDKWKTLNDKKEEIEQAEGEIADFNRILQTTREALEDYQDEEKKQQQLQKDYQSRFTAKKIEQEQKAKNSAYKFNPEREIKKLEDQIKTKTAEKLDQKYLEKFIIDRDDLERNNKDDYQVKFFLDQVKEYNLESPRLKTEFTKLQSVFHEHVIKNSKFRATSEWYNNTWEVNEERKKFLVAKEGLLKEHIKSINEKFASKKNEKVEKMKNKLEELEAEYTDKGMVKKEYQKQIAEFRLQKTKEVYDDARKKDKKFREKENKLKTHQEKLKKAITGKEKAKYTDKVISDTTKLELMKRSLDDEIEKAVKKELNTLSEKSKQKVAEQKLEKQAQTRTMQEQRQKELDTKLSEEAWKEVTKEYEDKCGRNKAIAVLKSSQMKRNYQELVDKLEAIKAKFDDNKGDFRRIKAINDTYLYDKHTEQETKKQEEKRKEELRKIEQEAEERKAQLKADKEKELEQNKIEIALKKEELLKKINELDNQESQNQEKIKEDFNKKETEIQKDIQNKAKKDIEKQKTDQIKQEEKLKENKERREKLRQEQKQADETKRKEQEAKEQEERERKEKQEREQKEQEERERKEKDALKIQTFG